LGLRIKNVILRDDVIRPVGIKGLDVINRSINNENHVSITGTKQQIDQYLQDKPILSERLRTLNNLPKFRIINTRKERIY
jgi:hypothetical protein